MWSHFLSIIMQIPNTVVAVLELFGKKDKKRKRILPTYFDQFFSAVCYGRTDLKNIIKAQILSEEPIFIYGSGGIGKSTVIQHSIMEVLDELINKDFKAVLYYSFLKSSSYVDACNHLSQEIDDSGVKDLKKLLRENKYLIWLDDCEEAGCLDALLRISPNPVFIVSSREKKQEEILKDVYGNKMKSLHVSGLSDDNAYKYLTNDLNRKIEKNHSEAIKKIAVWTNNHPFLIFLIKNEDLFNKNPTDFYKNLPKVISNKINKKLKKRKAEYSIHFLLKKKIGLDERCQTDTLSEKAKKMLGLLGCVSSGSFIYIDEFLGIFNKKTVKEVAKTKLVDDCNGTIKLKHPYVHKVLNENSKTLLQKDYTLLYDFIVFVCRLHNTVKKDSYDLSQILYLNKYHLLYVIKYVLNNNLITNYSQQETVCDGFLVLAQMGFYNEVLSFLKRTIKVEIDKNLETIINQTYMVVYEGLLNHDECISFAEKLESSIQEDNYVDKLDAFYNSLLLYLKYKKYGYTEKVFNKIEEIQKYLNQYRNSLNSEECMKEILRIKELFFEALWYHFGIDDIEQFERDLQNLIKEMNLFFKKEDFPVIDAKLMLAFISARKEEYNRALLLFADFFRTVSESHSFNDPYAIEDAENISDFFFDIKNYSQNRIILLYLLSYAVESWGNEHVITQRLRAKYQDNEAKILDSGFDETNVHINLVRGPKIKKDPFLKRFFKMKHI